MDGVETASKTTVRGGQIWLDGSFIRPSHRQPDMVSGVRPMISTLLCETTSPLYWKHLIHRTSFGYLPKSIPPVHNTFLTVAAFELNVWFHTFIGPPLKWCDDAQAGIHLCTLTDCLQEAKTALLENSFHSFINVSFQWVSRKRQAAARWRLFCFFRPGHGSLFHSSLSSFLKLFANLSLDPPFLPLFLFCVNQELISIWLVASGDLKGVTGNSTLLSCVSGK